MVNKCSQLKQEGIIRLKHLQLVSYLNYYTLIVRTDKPYTAVRLLLWKSEVIAVLLISVVYTLVFEEGKKSRGGQLSSGDFISHLIFSQLASASLDYCFSLGSNECNVFSSVTYSFKQVFDVCLKNKRFALAWWEFSVRFAFLHKLCTFEYVEVIWIAYAE